MTVEWFDIFLEVLGTVLALGGVIVGVYIAEWFRR